MVIPVLLSIKFPLLSLIFVTVLLVIVLTLFSSRIVKVFEDISKASLFEKVEPVFESIK